MSTNYSKIKLLPLVVIFLNQLTAIAQVPWTRVTPNPVEKSINDMVKIPGTNRLIAVCDGSTFMISDNTGVSWSISLHPAGLENDVNLSSLYFIDDHTGFIGGGYNSILKTTDGGLTWSLMYRESSASWWADISDICFMDDSTGFAVGQYSVFLKTNDGGDTWSPVGITLPNAEQFNKIDESKAYLTSRLPNTRLRTTDGGESWELETLTPGAPFQSMQDIHFINDSTAVASFKNEDFCSLYKTTNSGQTWDSICTPEWGILSTYFNFTDNLHGIALCGSIAYYSIILTTDDGGASWSQIPGGLDWQNLFTTCYYDPLNIFVAGSDGFLYKSSDGGQNWTDISHRELGGEIFDVQFVNKDVGFITCNSLGGGGISLELKRTLDAGSTWNTVECPCPYPSAFYFLSESEGFIAGDYELYKYNQGEFDTILSGVDFMIHEIDFFDQSTGTIVGENIALKTEDGGNTWTDIYPSAERYYNLVEFDPSGNIYVSDGNNIYKSTDGGSSWQTNTPAYPIEDLFIYANDSAFMISGGNIYYSFDGTQTWNLSNINSNGFFNPLKVFFSSAGTGYAVGDGEFHNIIKTTDGGINWNTIPTISTTSLNNVYFSDDNNGMVFGELGLICKTETGGVVKTNDIPLNIYSGNILVNPNPFKGEFILQFTDEPKFPVYLSITDLTGKTLKQSTITNEDQLVIQTDDLKPGTYFLRIKEKNSPTEIRKIIKI